MRWVSDAFLELKHAIVITEDTEIRRLPYDDYSFCFLSMDMEFLVRCVKSISYLQRTHSKTFSIFTEQLDERGTRILQNSCNVYKVSYGGPRPSEMKVQDVRISRPAPVFTQRPPVSKRSHQETPSVHVDLHSGLPFATVVTCLYKMPSKHRFDEYIKWAHSFLRTMNCYIVVFCDTQETKRALEPAVSFPERTLFIVKPIKDLDALSRYGPEMWQKELRKDPEKGTHKSAELGAIWYEKKEFVREAIEKNPFQTNSFIWCDIGILRDTPEQDVFLFGCSDKYCDDNRFHILNIVPCGAEFAGEALWEQPHSTVRFGGGIFGATKETWLTVSGLYDEVMQKMMAAKMRVFKDQSVWFNVVKLHKHLFAIHKTPTKNPSWFQMLHDFSSCLPQGFPLVINLNGRKDRWQEFRRNHKSFENILRFPAFVHKATVTLCGSQKSWTNGCTLSHLFLLHKCRHRRITVIEDDALVHDEALVHKLLQLLDNVSEPWHVASLGTSYVTPWEKTSTSIKAKKLKQMDDNFLQSDILSGSHFVVYNTTMGDRVVEMVNAFSTASKMTDLDCHIDYLFGRRIWPQPMVKLVPRAGNVVYQAASYSDVSNRTTDYTKLFKSAHMEILAFKS